METNRRTSGQTDTTDCSAMPSSVVGNKPQAYDKIIGVDASGGESCSTNVCTGRCSVASRRHLINIPFLGEFVTAENQ